MSALAPWGVRLGMLIAILALLSVVVVRTYSGEDGDGPSTSSTEMINDITILPARSEGSATRTVDSICPLGSKITDGSYSADGGLDVTSDRIEDGSYYRIEVQRPAAEDGPATLEVTISCETG